ncbi:unnamed protein product, partial [Staurois parvus]
MYVKCFETAILKKKSFFKIFKFAVPTSQGPEHRSRMPALAGGDGRGRCRGR